MCVVLGCRGNIIIVIISIVIIDYYDDNYRIHFLLGLDLLEATFLGLC